MAGLEGYFGPRHPEQRFRAREPKNVELVMPLQRPTDIDLQFRANTPVSKKIAEIQEDEEEALRRYVGIGVSLGTLITENLLSHPFLVLRRQCQVNQVSRRFHLIPVTLVPVIIHLHQRQGITTLWKGIGSVLLVRGLTLAVEDLVSKLTPWPKEIQWHSCSLKSIGQHILLKCLTLAIVTPFYSASLVETVQSDIASEKPGVFDVFKEGICRLLSWGSPQKGRMLPVWTLVLPTVVYGLFKYTFGVLVKNVASQVIHQHQKLEHEKKGAYPKDWTSQSTMQEIEVSAHLISLVVADTLFYPLETILHRLHLQGTRTIIDNLDTGFSVTPILTNYEGTIDCYDATISKEGFLGLYKGFGALILQFSAHFAVLQLVKYVMTQVKVLFKANHPTGTPTVIGNIDREVVYTPIR